MENMKVLVKLKIKSEIVLGIADATGLTKKDVYDDTLEILT